jgi:SanA protein
MSLLRTSMKICIYIVLLVVLVCTSIYMYMSVSTSSLHYDQVDTIPVRTFGLLLGTSRYTADGLENAFFTARIQATVDLYTAGKISHIIASGDNTTPSYNEPIMMRDALVERGIPVAGITLDYGGRRTLDSIVRAYSIFGQDRYTIISQSFHNDRALYIAQSRGISAIAYDARYVPIYIAPLVYVRELLARPLAIYDVYTHRTPQVQ